MAEAGIAARVVRVQHAAGIARTFDGDELAGPGHDLVHVAIQ